MNLRKNDTELTTLKKIINREIQRANKSGVITINSGGASEIRVGPTGGGSGFGNGVSPGMKGEAYNHPTLLTIPTIVNRDHLVGKSPIYLWDKLTENEIQIRFSDYGVAGMLLGF